MDTKSFNDPLEMNSLKINLLDYTLVKIRLWYGTYLSHPKTVNGIQLTYKNNDNGSLYETSERYGDHNLEGYEDYELENGERIEKIKVKYNTVINQLIFKTNRGRILKSRDSIGEEKEIDIEGKVVVGMYGGYGGHFHNIGFYMAPISEARYQRRKPFLLLRNKFEKNKDEIEKARKLVKEGEVKKENLPELAFALLVGEGPQTFAEVMRYV